jgi:hypothetical protein
MAQEITLQSLIEKIKLDLFSPYQRTSIKGKIVYPVFFIDQVELEVTVNLSYEDGVGVKISIPEILEGSATGGKKATSGNTMKIALKPILSREELRALIDTDEHLMNGIKQASIAAFRKASDLAGDES